jgi:hypothetical protein
MAVEIHKMLKETFGGDNVLGLTQTYKWFEHLEKDECQSTITSILNNL